MTAAQGLLQYLLPDGSGLYADGGTRTHKSWGTPGPKPGAFTSFATSAGGRVHGRLVAVVASTAGYRRSPYPTKHGGPGSSGATVLLPTLVVTPLYKSVGGALRFGEQVRAPQQRGDQTSAQFLCIAVWLKSCLLHRCHKLNDQHGLRSGTKGSDCCLNKRASARAACTGREAVAVKRCRTWEGFMPQRYGACGV